MYRPLPLAFAYRIFHIVSLVLDSLLTTIQWKDKRNWSANKLMHLPACGISPFKKSMRKYITSSIANIIYKQAIISLYDYADFLIESGPNFYQNRLNTLHEKALRIIDCNSNPNLSVDGLEYLCLLSSPVTRRHQHHCALMYRLSKQCNFLDKVRPDIHLRSRGKVKFKHKTTNLKGIDKSPFSHGKKLLDMIPENIQRALTKMKFKRDLTKIKL